MRDIAILLIFLPMLAAATRYVHIGTMLWVWSALAGPGQLAYGFALLVPFNKIVVGATFVALLVDRTKRRFITDATFVFHTLFVIQGAISFSLGLTEIERTYDLFDKVVKTWVLGCFMRIANRDRLQIHAMVAMVALSLGLHGILEGMKYILTGGAHKVVNMNILGDNNYLALALLMVLPLLLYLIEYSSRLIVRLGFIGFALLDTVGVIATSSRGGLIGLVVLAGIVIMQSKRKLTGIFIAAILGLTIVTFAPDRWIERMDTIKTAETDSSFMSRVSSWKMHLIVALNRPFTGAGYSALEDGRVYKMYENQFDMLEFIPSDRPVGVLAAHSIYFEVLGDLGLSGFVIFICMIIAWWNNLRQVKQMVRDDPTRRWAFSLARALDRCLVVYLISGAALSAAYFEIVYIELTLAAVLCASIRESLRQQSSIQPGVAARPGAFDLAHQAARTVRPSWSRS